MSSWVVAAQPPGGGHAAQRSLPAVDSTSLTKRKRRRAGRTTFARRRVDIGLVVAFSALAFVSFFRKSVTLKYVTLVASVIYIGFWKSTLLSIVNVFGLFGGNLPIFRYSLAWYLLAAITVVSTVLWGRVYCGRICAFGALTQLMDRVLPAKWRVNVPRAIERRASLIKYGILGGAIIYFIVTGNPGIYPYVEPFWMFGLHLRTPVLLTMLASLLIATVFVRNLYCRFLCPLGAFLGVLSKLTVFRIKRWSECKTCRICEKACEWGAIRGPEDHHDRVRALRRLRAALRGHEEVSAPPDHHQEGRHPRAARGVAYAGVVTPGRRRHAESPAEPRAGIGGDGNRDRIPVRTEVGLV